MEAQYFESENGKMFIAIYEDYFIDIDVFSFETKIRVKTGAYSTKLKLTRCIEECLESTKETFQTNFDKAKSILLSQGF